VVWFTEFLAADPEVPGLISVATRFSDSSESEMGFTQPRDDK
jgi:hypothetical protein